RTHSINDAAQKARADGDLLRAGHVPDALAFGESVRLIQRHQDGDVLTKSDHLGGDLPAWGHLDLTERADRDWKAHGLNGEAGRAEDSPLNTQGRHRACDCDGLK